MTTSPVLSEQFYTGGFVVSEAPNTFSRGTVLWDNTGGVTDLLVQAGTVFSYETAGTPVIAAKSGNTGNGTLTGVLTNFQPVQLGSYIVTVLAGGTTFSVTAPDGSSLSTGTIGTVYDDGIGFKLAQGGTVFSAGDKFTIVFAVGAVPTVTAGGTNVGNGTLTAVNPIFSAPTQLGNYLITFTAATAFTVTAPDGRLLPAGATGTQYQDEISFLLTAGGTPFAAGDAFTVGIATGTGYATNWTGAAPAAGIAFERKYIPAGTATVITAILRQAEVAGAQLQYTAAPPAAALPNIYAQLAASGIIVR